MKNSNNITCHSLEQYFDNSDTPCLSFNIEDVQHTPPYDHKQAHRHNYYEIYLMEDTSGKHVIDFEEYECTKMQVSVVFPRQVHQLNITKESRGRIVMFTEEIFCSEMLRKELRAYCIDLKMRLNNLHLTIEQFREISVLFEMINKLFAEPNIMQKEQIRHLIKVVILKLMDISKNNDLNKKETSESNIFLEFTNLVDDNYREIRMVSEYSEKMGITTKKLNTLSKKYNGQTALQVIHERIYMETRRMLAFSDYTHKEIAYELNFDSPSAFNKFVHNKSGLTPTELQLKLAQIYNKEE